jgi:hypothetical protein
MGGAEWVLKGGGSPRRDRPETRTRNRCMGRRQVHGDGPEPTPARTGRQGAAVSPRLLDPRVTGQYLGPAPSK